MSGFPATPKQRAQTMNRKRVIFWMTVGVGVVLFVMMTVLLGAIPPWPVWLFFAISHGFFCAVVWRVKPYRGPYGQPMREPAPSKQDRRGNTSN